MAETEKILLEIEVDPDTYQKLEGIRKRGERDYQPFYRDSVVKGALINSMEQDGLFVLAVDEEHEVETFLDTIQDRFEKADVTDNPGESTKPRIIPFRSRTE